METMQAAVCTKYGPPEVLVIARRRKPVPRADEVLIRIRAASVTNSDIFIRSSRVAWRLMIPMRLMIGIRRPRREIIGEVFAGVIEAAGPKTRRFRPGDRVYGLTGFSLGAYAEYKCMREVDSKRGCLTLMPRNLSFEEATAAAYGGLLALQFLEPAGVRPGDKVLIYGASGTSGIVAVQLSKHLQAEVTGVCGPANLGFVAGLGADKVLDYTDAGAVARLERYDLVVDCVGKARSSPLKAACGRSLTPQGRCVSIDDAALLLDSGRLDRVRDLVEKEKLRVFNDRCFNLDQIVEAHRYVELGHKRGNVAITVGAAT